VIFIHNTRGCQGRAIFARSSQAKPKTLYIHYAYILVFPVCFMTDRLPSGEDRVWDRVPRFYVFYDLPKLEDRLSKSYDISMVVPLRR
jgi:hypothetical protein